MIQWLNSISSQWSYYFVMWTIQNTIFLSIILLILYFLRDKNVRLLRIIAIIGFLKLLIPPVFFSQAVQSMEIIRQLPTITVVPSASLQAQSIELYITGRSLLFLTWFAVSVSFILTAVIRMGSLFFLMNNSAPLKTPKDLRTSSLPLIRLFSSDKISSPMIFGLLSYNLIVPISWKHMPETIRKSIIHHEIAHLRQKDQLVGILQMLGVALNFFHPLVWILNHQLNEYCEKACDDRALFHSDIKPKEYLNSLVTMAELSAGKNDMFTPALAFTKSYKSLKSRILHQARRKYTSSQFTPFNYVMIALILGGLIAFSCDLIVDSADQSSTPPATESLNTSEDGNVEFVPYNTPPEIIGGIAALRNNIEYPQMAKEAGVEGTVIVQAFINKNGIVDEVKIVKGVPRTGLDEAAIRAVKNTRFEPARQDDTPVGVWYSIPISFRLKATSHKLDLQISDSRNLTLNGAPVTIEELRQKILTLDPEANSPVIISGQSNMNMAVLHQIHKQLLDSEHFQVTYKVIS